MSEFRNKQAGPQGSRPRNTIDGFSRPPVRRQAAQPTPFGGKKAQQTIDNFQGPEGLTRRQRTRNVQSSIATGMALDEPVMVPSPKARRRSILPWRRRKDAKKDGSRWSRMSRRRKVIVIIASFLTLLGLIGGFLAFKGYLSLHKILKGGGSAAAFDTNVDPSRLKGEGDGRVNVLMLGRGGEGHEGADLTDTIILVSIDPIAKEASLLSIPRDLYVPVPGYGSMKINAAFSTGKEAALAKRSRSNQVSSKQAEDAGFDLIEQTVEKNLGVPVHYHTMIDFSGFKQAVDTVGGVDINAPNAVAEQMRIDGKNYMLNVKPGWQHMDGFKALAYSRSRHTSARGDFDRSERQRAIILALKQKILTIGTFSNPAKISGLLDTMGNHVSTNFSLQDLNRMYDLGKQIDSSKITSIGLADPPNNYVVTDNIGGLSVVVPRAGNGNFKEIQSYLRNILKDSFIRNENASIMVLNGTGTAGLASTKAEELKSYGYNITAVDNAPTKNYPKTVIVDMRNGSKKYTKNYLEKRFGVSTSSNIPDSAIQPGTSDFVIILGNDQATSR